MTKQNNTFLDNSKSANKIQNKLAVSITSVVEDGHTIWVLKILDPKRPHLFNGGLEFSRDERFFVIQYYADYIRYLLGDKTIKEPQPWNYDETIRQVPDGFDFSPYDGTKVLEKQLPIEVLYYAIPESNGRSNWSVLPMSEAFERYQIITFFMTECYNKGLFYFHKVLYLLGDIEEEPQEKDYDFTLYRNHVTGEFFKPEKVFKELN